MMATTLPTQVPESRFALMLGTPECVHVTLIGTGGTGSFLARSLGQLAWTCPGRKVSSAEVTVDQCE